MQEGKTESTQMRTPAGFTPRTGGLASEYAREMGWGLSEAERAKEPEEKQNADGGTNYDYGAADFGDTAKDTGAAEAPVTNEIRTPIKNEHKPPIVIVKPGQIPTRKTEQNSMIQQKPRRRIA